MATATAKKPDLSIITGGKPTFRTVEVMRRTEHDRWDLVQAIEFDIEERIGRQEIDPAARAAADGVKTGLYAVCDEIADAVRADGAEPMKAKVVADLYHVAGAWPRDTRIEGATYGAHERLFRREDRVSRLTKLVSRSSDGKVNRNDVDLWLSTLKTARMVTFLDAVEGAVRSALKAKGKPWSHVAQDDRDEIARRIRVIANEIENGEFGMPVS